MRAAFEELGKKRIHNSSERILQKTFRQQSKKGVNVRIPIIVGVTGHRALRSQDIPILRAAVSSELKKLTATYANSPFVMLNSIASGADTLCAEAALALGIRLVCPLPLPIEEYRKDFAGADAAAFDALIRRADSVFVSPDTEPMPENQTRDDHYRQAGIYVATHCHLLLALWDGAPAKPDGCGTAEAVAFMLKRDFQLASGNASVTSDGAVLQIETPRQGSQASTLASNIRLLENEPGSLHRRLTAIDLRNADASDAEIPANNA